MRAWRDAGRRNRPAASLQDRRRVREQPACPAGSGRATSRCGNPLRAGLRHQRRGRDRDQLPRAQREDAGRRGRGTRKDRRHAEGDLCPGRGRGHHDRSSRGCTS